MLLIEPWFPVLNLLSSINCNIDPQIRVSVIAKDDDDEDNDDGWVTNEGNYSSVLDISTLSEKLGNIESFQNQSFIC